MKSNIWKMMTPRDTFAALYLQKHMPRQEYMLENPQLQVDYFNITCRNAWDFADLMIRMGEGTNAKK